MMKVLLTISVFLLINCLLLSRFSLFVSAHSVDESVMKLYLVTDEKRQKLPTNQIQLVIFITWQQLSYIHEKGEDGKREQEPVYQNNAFDQHMQKILANPKIHHDYIGENIEIKAQGEDCEVVSLSEAPYNKQEVLIGEGVRIDGVVNCPLDPSKGIEVLNRMLFEDFPYQTHEVEVYLYDRLVAKELIRESNPVIKYPLPSPVPSPTPKAINRVERMEEIWRWFARGTAFLALMVILARMLRKNKSN